MIKPAPSKLLKLKKWLTLPEASKHLSNICGEEVTEADILRLALDKHLTLSVYFVNHATAIKGRTVPLSEAKIVEVDPGLRNLFVNYRKKNNRSSEDLPKTRLYGYYIDEENVFEHDNDKVIYIEGIWDLPMFGCEILDVDHEWQNLTGGPSITHGTAEGTYVQNQNGITCQLRESYDDNVYHPGSNAQLEYLKQKIAEEGISEEKAEKLLADHKDEREKYIEYRKSRPHEKDYYLAGGLPHDSVFVVRTSAIREFEQLLLDLDSDNNPQKKTHGNIEVNAQKREQILGAALSVITQWPEQCQNSKNKFEATKIAQQIDEKALLFWPDTGAAPLSRDKMEREISKWINKTGK